MRQNTTRELDDEMIGNATQVRLVFQVCFYFLTFTNHIFLKIKDVYLVLNFTERSPSLRSEPRQQRSHPYLQTRTNTHRQRPMIRPSSVVSMSGRSIAPSDSSENDDRHFDVDEEMESMSLDSPLPIEVPARPFPDKPYYWMNDYKTLEFIRTNFPSDSFYVMHNGKIIENFNAFIDENMGQSLVKYSFHLRVRGGKGGFGSLLRSFRVNKSTNKLMMRDLNGRRMASVDEEAKLKRYLEKQARKEQELKVMLNFKNFEHVSSITGETQSKT